MIAIASSVEQLGRYINCRGSMVGQAGHKEGLKEPHEVGVSATGQ